MANKLRTCLADESQGLRCLRTPAALSGNHRTPFVFFLHRRRDVSDAFRLFSR